MPMRAANTKLMFEQLLIELGEWGALCVWSRHDTSGQSLPPLVTEVELEDKDTHDAVHRVIRQALGELSANVDADFRLPR